MKSFSGAADRNKEPILESLRQVFTDTQLVLEIGSGTGQHAVFFAPRLPHLNWQPADLDENLAGIRAWVAEFPAPNLAQPVQLNIDDDPWVVPGFDAAYTANTIHIVNWQRVCRMFAQVGALLPPLGLFCTYGPFNRNGRYTSESNADFDVWLKDRDPESGIRDLEALIELAEAHGMQLKQDIGMPANNCLLVWRKQPGS